MAYALGVLSFAPPILSAFNAARRRLRPASLSLRRRGLRHEARALLSKALTILAGPVSSTRAPAQHPGIEIEVRPPRLTPKERAHLLDDLGADRGCGEPNARHLGCAAARRMAKHGELGAESRRALEATVTVAGRAPCVQRAAIAALAADEAPLARLALHRMRSVVRRRLEWDADPRDRAVLEALTAALPLGLSAG